MPITPTNTTFRDLFLTSRNFLQSNAGDPNTFSLDFTESISVRSGASTFLTNDPTADIVTWIGGNWDEEGFRNGDTISMVVYTISTGVVLASTSTTIDWINGEEIKVAASLPIWYTFPDSAVSIFVTSRKRQGMTLNVNMVGNGSQGSEFSVIDGEVTGFSFDFTTAGPTYTGMQYGDRSGMFNTTAIITLVSDISGLRTYILRIDFVQSGIYNSANYDFNNCLKLYARMNWESLIGEPFNNLEYIFSDDANTGWFNQAFNTGIIDSSIVQGINSIAYDSATTGSFVINSTSSTYAIGSGYVSGDENYYKNSPNSQSYLTLNIPTQVPTLGTPISSFTILGRNYTLEITSVIQVGLDFTFNFTFTPNPQFKAFIAALPEGDRTMYIWVRFGNVNLLVFSGQMTSQPAETRELEMVVANFIDHSDNTTNSVVLSSGYGGNVEDDIAFIGKYLMRKGNVTTYFRVGIEAFNFTTGESFTLQQSSISFANIPQVNQIYPVNVILPINSELPTTSEKINAFLTRDTTIDTALAYGIKIYYPFLLNWRYWLSQNNADSDFYPDLQTQNWVPFGNTDDWRLRLKIETDKDEINYKFLDEVAIKNYDTDPDIIQQVILYRDSDNSQVDIIIEGELMRVVGLNITANGDNWEQDTVWGMITIEPTESSPRFICSTEIPFDLNTSNPLTPLSGLYCSLTFPTPDVAKLECYFNGSSINLSNGVKFTIKIKGCTDGSVNKLTTTGVAKRTTDGNNKIKT